MTTSEDWDRVERHIVDAWSAGEVSEALSQIENVLSWDNHEFRGRALLYRGSIREDLAEWPAAKNDFAQAAELLSRGSYPRYTAELSVGSVCEKTGELEEAMTGYRAALVTCAQATELFSGAAAVKSVLRLTPSLRSSDIDLLSAVIEKSWRVLNLSGHPDLTDLPRSAEILMRRGSTSDT